MILTGLSSWDSVFKECNCIPLALAQHLDDYTASLVLVCLKHPMLASELRLLDDFNLAVRGLKYFGVSSWLLLTNSSWAFSSRSSSSLLQLRPLIPNLVWVIWSLGMIRAGKYQGQILAVWILAAKLPKFDLNIAVDWVFALSKEKAPEKSTQKSPSKLARKLVRKNSPT